MVIKWKTNNPTDSKVMFGTDPENLDQILTLVHKTTDHEVLLENLKPNTRYYYAIGNHNKMFMEDDPSYYFKTSPDKDHNEIIRIWAIGDFGTGDEISDNVRRGYMKHIKGEHTDVWIMLGDIAYYSGAQSEFQRSIFGDVYDLLMRNTVIWPTPGNHDMRSADSKFCSGPYYDIFTIPTDGSAGGRPSGKESYYSFNYGDIHFVSLDSEDTPRDKDGEMARWLDQDLESDQSTWKIVFFHHPAYTKGTHDSDREQDSMGRMKEMRENFLPILDKYGVDLVLGGHSHIYERSYLLYGHYGNSDELDVESMVLDQDNEKKKGPSHFIKDKDNRGTVYIVCGVSGSRPPHGDCDHPAMAVCNTKYNGSMAIDIEGNTLSGSFIDIYGKVRDHFTISKPPN